MKSWPLIYFILQCVATLFVLVALAVGAQGTESLGALANFYGGRYVMIYALEVVFCVITGLLLLVSLIMVILELILEIMNRPLSQKWTGIFCLVGGIVIVIAAILILTAGILWSVWGGSVYRHVAGYKYGGGVMAIISAVLYFVAYVFVKRHYGAGEEMCA